MTDDTDRPPVPRAAVPATPANSQRGARFDEARVAQLVHTMHTAAEIRRLYAAGWRVEDICSRLRMGSASVYNALRRPPFGIDHNHWEALRRLAALGDTEAAAVIAAAKEVTS